jgi:ribosomal protein S6E (S10)
MSDTPPDHLAIDARSPFHDADALNRGIGVRFNGVERDNVEEYSVSEGWIKVQVGKARDRRGNPMTLKIKGSVEVRYLDLKPQA